MTVWRNIRLALKFNSLILVIFDGLDFTISTIDNDIDFPFRRLLFKRRPCSDPSNVFKFRHNVPVSMTRGHVAIRQIRRIKTQTQKFDNNSLFHLEQLSRLTALQDRYSGLNLIAPTRYDRNGLLTRPTNALLRVRVTACSRISPGQRSIGVSSVLRNILFLTLFPERHVRVYFNLSDRFAHRSPLPVPWRHRTPNFLQLGQPALNFCPEVPRSC